MCPDKTDISSADNLAKMFREVSSDNAECMTASGLSGLLAMRLPHESEDGKRLPL
jgi:hypothetical protein